MSDRIRLDYVEFRVRDLAAAKAFYGAAFGWAFTDYGPDYAAFEDGKVGGGFLLDPAAAPQSSGSGGAVLPILFTEDLEAVQARVEAAGASVTERHDFPGGRRFHFRDPSGNALAVWTDRAPDGSRIP